MNIETINEQKPFMRMSIVEIMHNLGVYIKDLHSLNLKETFEDKEIKEILNRGSFFHKHMFE